MDLTANNHITELEEKKLKYFFTNIDISDQYNCKQRHEQKWGNCLSYIKIRAIPRASTCFMLENNEFGLSFS